MSANTRKISSGYKHLINEEILPLLTRAIETNRLSLSLLKTLIINMRRNLKSLVYPEQRVEKVLRESFPRWYDTDLLRNLLDHLGKYIIREDLDNMKRSIQTFNSTVDEFFASRVFLEGVGEDKQRSALVSIDPEWSLYPAKEFHLIYSRAAKALKDKRGSEFTIYFCSVLKECVIRTKIGRIITEFEKEIAKEYGGGTFPPGVKEESEQGATMLVTGKSLYFAIDESDMAVNGISGCSMFDEKQPGLLDYIKPFINYFET